MTSQIADRQAQSNNIEKLAAQRVLYSIAKRIFAFQIIASVPVVIFFSIATVCLKSEDIAKRLGFSTTHDISVYAASWGVFLTLFDLLILTPLINSLRDKAAKIQEYFDCTVLALPWNDVMAGSKPDEEDVHQWSNKYLKNKNNIQLLKNWYPPAVDGLPIEMSRLICQRTNCVWDFTIRKRYRALIVVVSLILFTILFVAAIESNLNFNTFFKSVFLPFLPALIISIKQFQENGKSIGRLETLKKNVEAAWKATLSKSKTSGELEGISRNVQDQIYLNRKSNPLIFDRVYWLLRSKQESSMYYSAERLLEEARTSLNG